VKAMTTDRKLLRCSEVWGGTDSIDLDVCSGGLTVSAWSRACDGGRGGDVYYFSVCEHDLLTRIAIADVMGHGQAVSLMGRWMYEALAERMNSVDGDCILSALNTRACQRGLSALTTAAVIGVYRGDSNLYFSYAGHPPLLMRRRGQADWTELPIVAQAGAVNLPLGVTSETAFEQRHVPVSPGDRLVLFTDGLVEAPGEAGDLFGHDRLLAALEASADGTPTEQRDAVLEAARRHTGDGAMPHDDVTLMVMEVS
jgi:sigma-B regulation protein RsbU (phosphoserine phosphatase)